MKKLENDQSFVDGYWVRFSVQNNTNKKNIGVTFNYNNEKKVFSLNNKTVIEYPYWNEKHDRWIDAVSYTHLTLPTTPYV